MESCVQWTLRYELRVVVLDPRQQAPLTPLEEAVEGELRVIADIHLISVRPDIQTDQHHAHTDGAVELAESGTLAQTERIARSVAGHCWVLCCLMAHLCWHHVHYVLSMQ